MSTISQITLPNGESYTFEGNVYLVEGLQLESTSQWIGIFPEGVSDYYHGFTINYFLPCESTTNPVVLNLSGKGNKPVYTPDGNVVTTHYPALSVIQLTYIVHEELNTGHGCFIATTYYNTNYVATKTSIGSARIINIINADNITKWVPNIPTQVVNNNVVVSSTPTKAEYSSGILSITRGNTTMGSPVDVTDGTPAELEYTTKQIPEVSVENINVITDITKTHN